MAHRLREDEDPPERQRRETGESELRRRVALPRRARRKARKHERQGTQGRQARQRGPGTLHAEDLLAVAESPEKHAEPHDAVADDHDGGKDGVAGERRLARAADQHHRKNERCLDDGDGERQNQRAERLTQPKGYHLGMVDRRKHRRDEDDPREHRENGDPRKEERDHKQRHSDDGDEEWPTSHRASRSWCQRPPIRWAFYPPPQES